MNKIAFIGAGNMNRAIIAGLVNNDVEPSNITVSNPSAPKREALANEYGINQTSSNSQAAEHADIVVLGVKPHLITTVCQEIAEVIEIEHKCFISVAAGTTMTQIQAALGENKSVIRAMPNTPSQLGLGVTGAFASEQVTDEQRVAADRLMKATGIVKWLAQESDIDHIIAVSGSGPAYFFLFMEAMASEAERLGFTSAEARTLVQQTALGAAQMVVENDIAIGQLRENVTSKGGTTQAALNAFTEGGLPELVSGAMQAAIARAKEMAAK
ncbi:pyrroline-5-carboxylate reductase [Thalassotalea euphylliae]|uniref:Pyrroline-5-carboxylate reductase n=1 Tax=Thalassotalea euphylliae TaxID=1655234 RepID=A0A3E0U5W6_9GAMM|nr:pyrroline-5-carboxylate reductase [Thalassotalea euphylliae]REL32189.1 pyrroline-5-carboxylate reductase [Thalassotalea euphylliae]